MTMTLITEIIEFAVSHPELVGSLAAGLAGGGIYYAKTGRVPIGRLPYRSAREIWREISTQYAGKPRPQGVPGLVVHATLEEVEDALRQTAHFESVDLYSYEYSDEALNLRRPSGVREHPETGESTPTELHVRVFRTGTEGTVWAIAHDEASRFEAWGPHMREDLLTWRRGRDQTETVLGDVGIEFERRASEQTAEDIVVAE